MSVCLAGWLSLSLSLSQSLSLVNVAIAVKVSASRPPPHPLSLSFTFSDTLPLSESGGGYVVEDAPEQSTVKPRERRILPPSSAFWLSDAVYG